MTRTPEQKALQAASELREAIGEAHGLIKDLRQATRDGRSVIDDLMTQKISDKLDAEVVKGLQTYQKSITKAVDDATEAVFKRFDTLAETLLGETQKTRRQKRQRTIPELVEEAAAKKRRSAENDTFPS